MSQGWRLRLSRWPLTGSPQTDRDPDRRGLHSGPVSWSVMFRMTARHCAMQPPPLWRPLRKRRSRTNHTSGLKTSCYGGAPWRARRQAPHGDQREPRKFDARLIADEHEQGRDWVPAIEPRREPPNCHIRPNRIGTSQSSWVSRGHPGNSGLNRPFAATLMVNTGRSANSRRRRCRGHIGSRPNGSERLGKR